MYRVRSTDVWFNAPGVVAAYQPVAAPGSLAARQNVGNDACMIGKNTATPGVLPAWSGARGWIFNRSEYLLTGISIYSGECSMLACSTPDGAVSASEVIAGTYSTLGGRRFSFGINTTQSIASWSNYDFSGGSNGAGVRALVRNRLYINSTLVATAGTSIFGASGYGSIYIGALDIYPVRYFFGGAVSSLAFFRRVITGAEICAYSRQMAYCHVNPDWSAWGRRRRYYYAPSAAAGNVGIYGRRGSVALPGGVRIEAVQ